MQFNGSDCQLVLRKDPSHTTGMFFYFNHLKKNWGTLIDMNWCRLLQCLFSVVVTPILWSLHFHFRSAAYTLTNDEGHFILFIPDYHSAPVIAGPGKGSAFQREKMRQMLIRWMVWQNDKSWLHCLFSTLPWHAVSALSCAQPKTLTL